MHIRSQQMATCACNRFGIGRGRREWLGRAHHEHFLSPLLAPMLSSAAMRAVCDDAAFLQHMLDFEAALARAEAATGVIPAGAPSRSQKPATPGPSIWRPGRGGDASGNLAIPLVKALTAKSPRPTRMRRAMCIGAPPART